MSRQPAAPAVDDAILAAYDRLNAAVLAAVRSSDPRRETLIWFRRAFVGAMHEANLELAGLGLEDAAAEHLSPAALPDELEAAPREELSCTAASKHDITQHTLH